jgi:hypothetical protein
MNEDEPRIFALDPRFDSVRRDHRFARRLHG